MIRRQRPPSRSDSFPSGSLGGSGGSLRDSGWPRSEVGLRVLDCPDTEPRIPLTITILPPPLEAVQPVSPMLSVHYRRTDAGNLLLSPFELATQFRPLGDLLCERLEGPGGAHDRISLTMDGTLRVSAGYRWSSRVVLWGNRYTVRASLVHSALYALMRHGLISARHRKAADCLFFTILFQTDMAGINVWLRYAAVRLFGGKLAARQRGRAALESWAP